MAEYIEREAVIANLMEQIEKGRDTAECEATELVIKQFAEYISSFPAADVQPVDKNSLHIIYIGRKAYYAENTIMEFMKKMDIIRDSLAHIENYFDKNKELLHSINCCTKGSDDTSKVEYFINRIKENCGYD